MIFSHIGYYSLLLGLIISLIAFFYSIFSYKKKNYPINKNIFLIISTQFFITVISFLSLIGAFVVSDFSNQTVYNNSHSLKPLFYKISGTWGNHEGSLLLWLLVLTFFIFIFIFFSKKQQIKYRYLTIAFHQIIVMGFFFFLIITSNPFNFIYPTPNEGLGLNPILQDPALAIHPPILYLGYVGSSIIFSSCLAAMVTNNVNTNWARHLKKWVVTAWVFLTLGIMLGSIWAYYELGWGGFWFWDPVENVSLIPWLCLTALLHTVIVLEKRNLLKSWTLILSIATFAFSISGTFLVRSGILNSVHTFANDPERGIFILSFLFVLIAMSLIIFFIYSQPETENNKKFFFISKETSILVNNWFMMYFLSVVIVGTIYPIFLEVLISEKISIGPPFYNKLITPFLIPFLLVMAVGPNFKWIKEVNKRINYNNVIIFIVFLFISYFINKFKPYELPLISILIASTLYLIFSTTKNLFKINNISQTISHFGFSIFIISILFNIIFSYEFSANMKLGDEIRFKDELIKLTKIETSNKKNYSSIVTNFEIVDSTKNKLILKPEIRIYNQPNILTSEADIISTLFYDKFIVVNLIKGNEFFNVRYQVKPFMLWMWFSICLISMGGVISLIKRNYK